MHCNHHIWITHNMPCAVLASFTYRHTCSVPVPPERGLRLQTSPASPAYSASGPSACPDHSHPSSGQWDLQSGQQYNQDSNMTHCSWSLLSGQQQDYPQHPMPLTLLCTCDAIYSVHGTPHSSGCDVTSCHAPISHLAGTLLTSGTHVCHSLLQVSIVLLNRDGGTSNTGTDNNREI